MSHTFKIPRPTKTWRIIWRKSMAPNNSIPSEKKREFPVKPTGLAMRDKIRL
jgi:hypothetical protein